MKTHNFLLSALAAASISSASAATLTTLAYYDGVGTNAAQSLISHDADLNSVASSLALPPVNFTSGFRGSSVAVNYTTVANSTYWNGTIGLTGDSVAVFESAPFFSSGSTAAAFTAGDFFSFTVKAIAGYEMTPDRLGFWFSADDAGSAELWEARYSINGAGFNSLGSGSVPTAQGTNLSFIDLDATGIGTLTDAQTLRIDIAYAGASDANGDFRAQDIVLTGTSIPEPSAAALLGLAGFGLLHRRRH